jgi:hypothetical protein
MTWSETPLAILQRHVREGEDHLLHQQTLASHLAATHSPLVDKARALLVTFEASQDDHRSHLGRIMKEIRSGQRDVDGNLVQRRPS